MVFRLSLLRQRQQRTGPDFLAADDSDSDSDAINLGNVLDDLVEDDDVEPEDMLDLVAQPTFTETDNFTRKWAENYPHATLVKRSRALYKGQTMNVNIYGGEHFSYIKNLNMFCETFRCPKCMKMFDALYDYK